MAYTLSQMIEEGMECVAVGARDLKRAKEFASEYHIKKAYGSYEELVSDEEIDVIYIATPHSLHYEHTKLSLEHGRNVLCEKPITVNARQTRDLIQLAKEKELLLAEAMWTRFLPMRKVLDDLLGEHIIGEVKTVTANIGYCIDHVLRLQDPKLAGGALLDIGIYTLNFAAMVLGLDIKEIESTCIKTDTGVDLQNMISLVYNNGTMAVLNSTIATNTDLRGMIYGSKGYIEFVNINNCEKIIIMLSDGKRQVIERPKQITGFEYQVRAVCKALEAGELECIEMPHKDIIAIMELMDLLRSKWGIIYPCE